MVIIAKAALTGYAEKHPDALVALLSWYDATLQAQWNSLATMKNSFNSVDYAGNDRYVFNIKGNKYRLVAMIHFSIRTVYVKFIGTYAEYDKIDVSKIDFKP
jgi:mRNA interferase HigB